MKYERMPIEIESPEEYGYEKIKYNLSESSIADQTLSSLGLTIPDLTLLYNEHQGSTQLRDIIASDAGVSRDDVLITGGAAGALFIIATSQLSSDDHIVVVRPNYATNIETPRAIGCQISYVDLTFDDGFQPDLSYLEYCITPKTKILSITCPHNPTGTSISRQALDSLVALTKQKDCILLVDETYRDVHYGTQLPVAASLADHVISVSSLSKSYGVPGIRLGWIITRDQKLQTTFLAAKEQISISGSVINEWIASELLSRKQTLLKETNAEMESRLQLVKSWVEREEMIEWVEPVGGVVCFPKITKEPAGGIDAFYKRLLNKYQTYVGPGHWFEMPDAFFRLGFGWPTREELLGGMEAISKALRDSEN
ncbi:hypothetical protein N7509_003961 [Penicillium cosmopolitanum]|uniref:Aminotransferase class I/classII large domain-containing protein n=1 Tax=Penicillium cosmopolitanum TaxID=1131564 RepID=A0A9W9W617_9EURO|nr:uncharacterized protein N7509_003961 [Penicillium cosmopolitanum]KAJ5404090.1 hypothetical protein N7509_003961 [Penicillium cosmopolitanum]